MATIKDVAAMANVSMTTVSRVLNRDKAIAVTPEVRLKIFEAARKLDYRSPRQRKAALEKKQLLIGIADWQIIRAGQENIQLYTMAGMHDQLDEMHEAQFVRLNRELNQEVDGIMAFGRFERSDINFLQALSPNLVFVNSDQEGYENDQVKVDFDQGVEDLVSYLMDQKQYASVGYIGGLHRDANALIGARRLASFRTALKRRGVYEERYFKVGDLSRESGYTLAQQMVREKNLARAIVLGSDEVAEGAMEAFCDLGIRVPEDVATVFYRDILTLHSKWNATCIEMFPDYVWENAMDLLIGRIVRKREQAVTVLVPTRMKIGDTA